MFERIFKLTLVITSHFSFDSSNLKSVHCVRVVEIQRQNVISGKMMFSGIINY